MANKIKIIKKKARKAKHLDAKKENIIKNLRSKIQEKGIKVRREALKQGYGWKATSGSCYVKESSVVFLDSKLLQDDQINFLEQVVLDLGLDQEISSV